MKSQVFSGLKFPEFPKNHYRTAPIYIEPMIGSGERLTVVGIVIGESEFLAEKLILPTVAESLYGKQGQNLLGFADMIIADFNHHMQRESIETWTPCMDGVDLGLIWDGGILEIIWDVICEAIWAMD